MSDMPCFRGGSIETFAKRKWLLRLLNFAHVQIQNVRAAQEMQLNDVACEHLREMAGELYIAYLIADEPYEEDLLELSSQVAQWMENYGYLSKDRLDKLDRSILSIRDGIERT